MSPNEKILALIQEVGANVDYCGGTSVSAYLDESLFEKNHITVQVQNWTSIPYTQLYSNKLDFIPNLSILDLLFNVPIDRAREILSSDE
jgi:hypothetical protein